MAKSQGPMIRGYATGRLAAADVRRQGYTFREPVRVTRERVVTNVAVRRRRGELATAADRRRQSRQLYRMFAEDAGAMRGFGMNNVPSAAQIRRWIRDEIG